MHDPQRISCAADDLPKDDIDELFEKLQPLEPPPALIRRILTSVSDLPRPTAGDIPLHEKQAAATDSPTVKKGNLPPC